MSLDELRENCHQSINNLFDKYNDNTYILGRINRHIVNYLPNILDNELKNHNKRIERNSFLLNEQNLFIHIFLNNNKFYYLQSSGFFYEYFNKKYNIVNDDDVIHKLLSSISKERILLQWKYKTKLNVLKLIKERSLFSSIPESRTIQNVINVFYPSIFTTKNITKYFLTIIGDNILKKSNNIIFIVNQKNKKILIDLDNIGSVSIGVTNISHNFMTRYHENHSHENYRLIKMNDNVSNDLWIENLKKYGLDIICVAAHYSNRHINSDNYLDTKSDEDLKNYSYYLKNIKQDEIIKNFCNICLEKVSGEKTMEWKNLHFIWKQYLSSLSIPNVIYSNTLKTILKGIYDYNEINDSFNSITSKYLPIESDFIQFWDTTISISYNLEEDVEGEIELDELCMLFKYWVKQNTEIVLSSGNITEDNVHTILKHFFPNVNILEDKYVLNISCNLWNKNNDINNSLNFMKNKIYNLPLISFDEIYNNYYIFCNTNSYKFIVSMRYFEKNLLFHLKDFIVYDEFIQTKWFIPLNI